MSPPVRILVDGADDDEGRGLLVLSALALAADELTDVSVRVINGDDVVMHAAAECLHWDTGLDITVAPRDANLAVEMEGASLYVGVVVRSAATLALAAATAAGVPSLTAVQFPGPQPDAMTLSLVRAAHKPRVLARAILNRLVPSA